MTLKYTVRQWDTVGWLIVLEASDDWRDFDLNVSKWCTSSWGDPKWLHGLDPSAHLLEPLLGKWDYWQERYDQWIIWVETQEQLMQFHLAWS